MRELKDLDWVAIREEKKSGKGRPFKVYRLEKKIDSIIEQLERQKTKESQQMLDNIQKLKRLQLNLR